ncbi:unnamed protein product [Clonostachys rosea f. rosea IK726]|uniref:Telomere-associated protein Rif1 N-terminal domain-containing protein n=2 Tax=Bionectria ochroleuca TaxID=29856 RepID=A0A0B7K322_BIOOC|nr:unnamed protein product [Clonostachys rosea f. rosea IK726]
MASLASGPTVIESLPPRPPTPPRDLHRREGALDLGLKSLAGQSPGLQPRASLHTPPTAISPSPSATANSNRSSQAAKRVEWSTHTDYQEPPDYNKDRPRKSSPLSAPSSASSKPIKGILKQTPSSNIFASSWDGSLDGSLGQASITEMLDSTIKQLAGADRDFRRDAYMMLSRALKTSNNLPDRVALQDKMSLLMQFIQRDVTSKKEDGSPDTTLVNHALGLLATFLHFPAIASTITSDFAVFIIDHSIRCFEDPTLSKDVARHLMQVVAFQNFSAKVMTLDRVGRLVASLHKIENHLMGKSIVMSRIQIYRRLVKQSRVHMLAHSDWLKDMFTDMLSTIRDIQTQAINLGMEAGYTLRTGNQLFRKVIEILQTTNEDQRYSDFYIRRLQEMIKDRQFSATVPQVWSVVILCLRCPLERWEDYGAWFALIQSAFNSSDTRTKIEANYAWSRYIYLSLHDNRATPKLLGTLCQPLLSQIRRKATAKQLEENVKLRKTVISVFCTLCYYGLRPGHDRIAPTEMFWDSALHPFISQLAGLDGTREVRPDDLLQASRILIGLLDVSTPVVWREDRIMDLPPVKPDELPSIDSKWIRKNSDRIFRLVGPLLEKKLLDMANMESLPYRLWQALVGSIAAASAKDIKVSEDTAKFMASALGLISRIWSRGCLEGDDILVSRFYPSVLNLLKTLINGLGHLPFTEKRLSMTVANTFEPIATPSQRSDRSEKSKGLVRNSLLHLFSILSAVPAGASDDQHLADFFLSAFSLFLVGKPDKFRTDLTRELLQLLPSNSLSPFAPWLLGAQSLHSSYTERAAAGPPSTDKILGPEYREVVSHLELGFSSYPNLPIEHWLTFLDSFSKHVTAELGDAGRALTVTDPLAKVLLGQVQGKLPQQSSKDIKAINATLGTVKFPHDKKALEVVRRKLWGDVPMSKNSVDPYGHLYKLLNFELKYFYDNLAALDAEDQIAEFLNAVNFIISDSFSLMGFECVSRVQDGLSAWFQDEKSQLPSHDETPLSTIVRKIWNQLCAELSRHEKLTKTQFDQVEGALEAAFKSRHASIVNSAVETWNVIVKDEEELVCSDSLKSIVSSLRPKADLVVPGEEPSSGEFGAQATSFISSQGPPSPIALSSGVTHEGHSPLPMVPTSLPELPKSRVTRKRQLQLAPDLEQAKPKKRVTRSSRTSTPRLRHDNSQIQFEPIASSSPVPEESQHLTERQKETRARQAEEAGLYTVMSSNLSKVETTDNEEATSNNDVVPSSRGVPVENATPQKAASYEEIISSTPTPRRGQVILLDEANEPPSSPIEPRPCPLLSEIRSRSRAGSSLEGWEFSSPPGTPVSSRQQVVQDLGVSPVVLTAESTQPKEKRKSKARSMTTRSTRRSSAAAKKNAAEDDSTPKRREVLEDVTEQHKKQSSGVSEVTNAGEEEPTDAKKVSDGALSAAANKPAGDVSFALSDGDESQMLKFIDEIESKRAKTAVGEFQAVTPVKQAQSAQTQNEPDDSPMPEGTPTVIPSTPLEMGLDRAELQVSDKKRKRKRGRRPPGHRKKRKSVEVASTPMTSQVEEDKGEEEAPVSQQSEQQQDIQEEPEQEQPEAIEVKAEEEPEVQLPPLKKRSAPSTPVGVRTRRSARKEQREQKEREEAMSQASNKLEEAQAAEDTDEELMSQLLSESNAVSQSEDGGHNKEVPSTIEDSTEAISTDKMSGEKEAAEEAPADVSKTEEPKADSIMETLGNGLNLLRTASLTRGEVNKIEDMFMDMKRALYAAEERGRQS